MDWQAKIIKNHSENAFEDLAFEVFRYQLEHCEVYADYVSAISRKNPSSLSEIPFLPISFFKNKYVCSNEKKEIQTVFKSSGTQGIRSSHYVADLGLYVASFEWTYRKFIGNPENQIILALLPNYLEQGDSSLVFMVDRLINMTDNVCSQFILDDISRMKEVLIESKRLGKDIVIFGVAYSLLDLCDYGIDLNGIKVIETGGMKGKRKELSKEDLHLKLSTELRPEKLYSEYGMTELMSQAYSNEKLQFDCPPWMKVLIRDIYDPFSYLGENKRGGINVIDLANVYSCSFIATDDTGISQRGKFQLKGRTEKSDLRGCNLLVE